MDGSKIFDALFMPARLGLQTTRWLGGKTLEWFDVGDRLSMRLEAQRYENELQHHSLEVTRRLQDPEVVLFALRSQHRSLMKIMVRGFFDDLQNELNPSEDRRLAIKTLMHDYMPDGTTFDALGYEGIELDTLRMHFPDYCREQISGEQLAILDRSDRGWPG